MYAEENLKRNVLRRRRNQNALKNVAVCAPKIRNVNTKTNPRNVSKKINPKNVSKKINPKNVTVSHKQKNAKVLPHLKVRRNVNAREEKPRQEFQDQHPTP